jgi:hypothetical protein
VLGRARCCVVPVNFLATKRIPALPGVMGCGKYPLCRRNVRFHTIRLDTTPKQRTLDSSSATRNAGVGG